jgi:hypothetical protein
MLCFTVDTVTTAHFFPCLLLGTNASSVDRLAPIGKRELLRLWLSHPSSELSWPDFLSKQFEFVKVLAALAEGVIWYR